MEKLQRVDSFEQQSKELEAAHTHPPPPATVRARFLLLAAWFALNLALTISNKLVLSTLPFPWLLTTLHTSATALGCCAVYGFGNIRVTRLNTRETLVLVGFSVLFTLNIALSNISLALVSVPLHQIIRSTIPISTIFIYRAAYGKTYSTATYLTMVPLIAGVGLATAGDYYCTLLGFLVTVLGNMLASVKTVATNELTTGSLQLPSLELLLRMSPLATSQCVVYACGSGEVAKLYAARNEGVLQTPTMVFALAVNAAMAFLLNIISFETNKVAGALTLTVAGNVKQALTVMLGILLFRVEIGLLNTAGMLVTLGGAAWYSKLEIDQRQSI
ncbi:hypothetical protein BAUCODRAFT_61563 [Baudoinia panamericana UAMH 10762]|uniref:Sugar phosphate transporter domain-containing protein n=1 Tax=Baudoinia panamericana (strain UAMH 10762) TaxID=717646 RepID=M2NMJ3_BAUPA|nr:uncharacterized protein BAUCODRAFT_61563 [Baudoinia panamericana UAMH 10762]EMD00745.1 hypothetical protein BAUCODRAFT_61563 [Baudoinia panamericana UAMH 10762]